MIATSALAAAERQVRSRPLFCVVSHLHRDGVVAEAVCGGRFRHAGIELDLGLEPDWLGGGLPDDEEWRIEWSKFSWGLDLAHAFRDTGERRFLRVWEQLVGSWIAQVPSDHDASEVAARRLQFWLYAWDGFASAPQFRGLEEGLDRTLLASIAQQAAHVRGQLSPERNHRTLELYALFLVPLAFPELDLDGSSLAFATDALHRDLLDAFRPDGVHREASTHYHLIVLRSFLGARENARRYGLRFPDGYDRTLERACELALHVHRPDGGISALSDSDGGCYSDVLALAGSAFDRPDFVYAATRGRLGARPARSSASFPDGGYFFQRSGWGAEGIPFEQERYLVFDCGPLGDGGHGHYDLLSVEVAAGGRPLLVDPGRYTYAEGAPNLRRWFKGTAAHNTVLVDGLDQTPYRRGKPKGAVAEGRFLGRRTAPGLELLEGEATSPAYEAVHRRTILFVAGEYWLIEDNLSGERAHRFDLRFHLGAEAWERILLEPGRATSPGLALVVEPAIEPSLEPGWVAPEYGSKHRAPVVSLAVEERTRADFVTLVFPTGRKQARPSLRVRRVAGVTVAQVRSAAGSDLVAWSRDRAAWRRREAPG